MKKRLLAGLICTIFLMTIIMGGCSSNKNQETQETTTEEEKTSELAKNDETKESNINEFDKMKTEDRELEITLIPGFFSDDLWQVLMDGFQEDHPNWKITRETNPQAGKNDQTRILSGNAPGFFQGDPTSFNMYNALNAGVLVDIEDILNTKGYDSDTLIKDQMLDGFDKTLASDGNRYFFSYRYATNGVWYNEKLFDENGWSVPQSWDEFMQLCEKIKSNGVTPLVFAGKVPQYPMNMFVYPMIGSMGDGLATLSDISNLKPEAWKSEPVRKALENFMDMYNKGYFKKDVLGLDHTQSQMEFFQGRAAMVLSGSWLELEMKDSIPEGFQFAFMAPPVTKTTSDTKFVPISPGGFLFCNDSKFEKEAKEFARYIYSNSFMKEYIETSGEPLVTNKEALAQADMSKISNAAKSITEVMGDNKVRAITMDYNWGYTSVYMAFCNGVIGLIAGNETIDSVMDKTENEAEKVRNDSNIKKYDFTIQ